MMRVFMAILCSFGAVCSVSAQSNRQEGADRQAAIYRLPLMERAIPQKPADKKAGGWRQGHLP